MKNVFTSKVEFPSAEQFEQNKVECSQMVSWKEVPTEVIYYIEKVGQITKKSGKVIMELAWLMKME